MIQNAELLLPILNRWKQDQEKEKRLQHKQELAARNREATSKAKGNSIKFTEDQKKAKGLQHKPAARKREATSKTKGNNTCIKLIEDQKNQSASRTSESRWQGK